MKAAFRFILSKTFIFALFALCQIVLLVLAIIVLGGNAPEFYLVLTILSLLAGIVLFEKDDLNPAYKLLWLFAFAIFPFTSGLFYFVMGRQKLSKRNKTSFLQIEKLAQDSMGEDKHLYELLEDNSPQYVRCARYLKEKALAPIYTDTFARFFNIGEEFYNPFLDELKKAQKSIFMEYFIISDEGKMWPKTLDVLKEKAAQGVDVRIIYDSFGCLFTLPGNYYQTLRSYGIKCHPFNAIKPSMHINDYLILNNRDHRKICVIDGEVGFTGGVNFSDEYINETSPYGVWKDSAFMIKGPAVYSLTTTFLGMWSYLSGEAIDCEKFKPTKTYPNFGDNLIQPYCDSPLDNENVSENSYFNILNVAKDYVYITTPYLIIDHEMVTNLQLAAKSGVDVRIILPGKPDKWIVFMLTQSYYRPLLAAGVKIYEYTPGFIHSKMYVSDDEVAIVGSANMDYRSLYLHFENCCTFYGGHIVQDVKRDMLATIADSTEITLQTLKTNPVKKIFQLALRIFAPLM